MSFTASVQYNIYNIHRGDAAAGLHNNVPGPDLYLLRALCQAQAYCNDTSIYSNFLNFRPGKWQWQTTKFIIYQEESESGFAQIAELGFLEIWPIYQVK